MRHAARADTGQKEFIDALRACGVWCLNIKWPVDYLCWWRRHKVLFLLELKGTTRTPLTDIQKKLKQLAETDDFPVFFHLTGVAATTLLDKVHDWCRASPCRQAHQAERGPRK